MSNIRWDPGRLSFHPGPKGEYAVVRWTAPRPASYDVQADFLAIDQATTTDVHVLHNGKSLWLTRSNWTGAVRQTAYTGEA